MVMLSLPWFMCIFVTYVPMEVCLRILDLFFCEGPSFLLAVGLAILQINENALLAINEGPPIVAKFKENSHDSEVLLKVSKLTLFCFVH
jgi:hypothetical protein